MDLRFSELGLGCSSFWAKQRFPEAEALRIVHAAIDEGVTFFDTGGHYAGGNAERRLGKALEGRAVDGLVVATKAGTETSGSGITKDFSPQGVRRSVERSLRQLRLDSIPLLHLHDPRGEQIGDELCAELEKLRDDGLVRYFGVNGGDEAAIQKLLRLPLFDSLMLDYNVLRRPAEALISRVVEAGKCFIAATPLAQMLFSRRIFRVRRPADAWYLLRALKNHRKDVVRGRSFRFLDRVEGWTGAQAAMAYVLADPGVSCAVFGTTSVERLRSNLETADRTLPEAVTAQILAAQG